jgi:hypothetical protein
MERARLVDLTVWLQDTDRKPLMIPRLKML